jgi:hypothetical protein
MGLEPLLGSSRAKQWLCSTAARQATELAAQPPPPEIVNGLVCFEYYMVG